MTIKVILPPLNEDLKDVILLDQSKMHQEVPEFEKDKEYVFASNIQHTDQSVTFKGKVELANNGPKETVVILKGADICATDGRKFRRGVQKLKGLTLEILSL